MQVDLEEQLDTAFELIRREPVDGLMVAGSAITYSHYPRIVAFSAASNLPTIYGFREAVEAGGLVSYGTTSPASLVRWRGSRIGFSRERDRKSFRPSRPPVSSLLLTPGLPRH